MWVSEECFHDEEMKRAVMINGDIEGICDFSGRRGRLIEIEFFYDFFDEVLSLFKISDGGRTLIEIIQDDWTVFASDTIGKAILDWVCKDLAPEFNALSPVVYSEAIIGKIRVWDDLKKSVMRDFRFFSSHDSLDSYSSFLPQASLRKKTVLYRARILPKDKTKLKTTEMGCPPASLSTAGRANPPGISYLYLCGDEPTTYYEVRAVHLDRLCVGRFLIQKDLKIVDFNAKISLYLAFDGNDLVDVVASKKIMDAIRQDMSRPMRRYDSELEYIPTQMICEYCKVQGADGICFDSTLHKGGKNYVLFDSHSAKCTKIYYREVNSIAIKVDSER